MPLVWDLLQTGGILAYLNRLYQSMQENPLEIAIFAEN